jgi:hypothetical protein
VPADVARCDRRKCLTLARRHGMLTAKRKAPARPAKGRGLPRQALQ